MKLNPKQLRFVHEYLIDLNATQAAVRAGYSPKTANQSGPRLLVHVGVAKAISEAQAKSLERTQINADWLLQRLSLEADADLADLYGANGVLKPVTEWPMVWRKGLVAGIETAQEFDEVDGKKIPAGMVHKVKLSDRIRRLELIGKHVAVGAFAERGGQIELKIELKNLSDSDLAREVAFLLTSAVKQQTVQ